MAHEMHPVDSSHLHSVGHDGSALYVAFKDRKGGPVVTYRYDGVPAEKLSLIRGVGVHGHSPGKALLEHVTGSHHGGKWVGVKA